MTVELEQHLLDMGEELKEAVVSVSQSLVDLAEKLAGDEAKITAALEAIAKAIPGLSKQNDGKGLADALARALKGITITAPEVNVTVENKVPAQPAPVVNITGAKKWRHVHKYDEHGRVVESTSTRVE